MAKSSAQVRFNRLQEFRRLSAAEFGLPEDDDRVTIAAAQRLQFELLQESMVYDGKPVNTAELLELSAAIKALKPAAAQSLTIQFLKPDGAPDDGEPDATPSAPSENDPAQKTPDANQAGDALKGSTGHANEHQATIVDLNEAKARTEVEQREAIRKLNSLDDLLADRQHARDRWRGQTVDPSRARGYAHNPFTAKYDAHPYYIRPEPLPQPQQDWDRMPPGSAFRKDV